MDLMTFYKQTLLEDRHYHLFTYDQWLNLYYNDNRNRDHIICKLSIIQDFMRKILDLNWNFFLF